jgi:hypothetical protein
MTSSDDEEPMDLDAELDALDVDKDFSLWTSFRSRRSIASSASASEDRDLDLSLISSDEHTASVHSANQVELDDFEYWRIRRYMRDEVFSPKYKPSASEEKEFQELLTFLGMNRKKMFEKQDEKWNQLSAKTNIVMKRGPILLNGQERELVLLLHGFVLALVQEASSKNALARLMIARTYEQCELYNAIEYVRSVPVTEDVIIEVEEEEENETGGVEVDVGETLVVGEETEEEEPPAEQNEVVAIRIGNLAKSSSSSFEDEDSSSTSSDESLEQDDSSDDVSGKEEDCNALQSEPETKPNEDVSEEVDDDREIFDGNDDDDIVHVQEDTSGTNEVTKDHENNDKKAKASEAQADTNDSAGEIKQLLTIDLDDASVESGSEADKEAKEILEKNDSDTKPESAPSSPVTSPQRRQFLGIFGGRKNESQTNEEPKDDAGPDSDGSEDDDDAKGDVNEKEPSASSESSADRRQFLGIFGGRMNEPQTTEEPMYVAGPDSDGSEDDDNAKGDEKERDPSASESSADRRQFLGLFGGRKTVSDPNAEAKDIVKDDSKNELEENAGDATKNEAKDRSSGEATSPEASAEKRSFMGIFGSPPSSPDKHVKIRTPPKKKQVTIQQERYRFEIKTETDEFNFECATKLHKEAWVEALERILVKTRSRSRSNKDRVRGWQHALVQTSLHSAAVTGLDELCRKDWLGAVNELDKYNSLSALHYAVMSNMMHIMDWLLRNGADPEIEDEDGRTPMYYAQRDELTGAQALLLDYGAKRSRLQDVEERGTLFQGAAQIAEEKLAAKSAPLNGISKRKTRREEGKPSTEGDLKSYQHAATEAHGAMADAMNELRIRGEKINDLAVKANDLEENVNTYGDLAKQMKARAKKKKWYNLK